MISVGNRDGRKGLEQAFSINKREMDETELEEGEACSYHDDDEEDASIDLDVSLSYLDEKLQNVLGHFQKDFEGVVSAQNLGAKYGTYGSFLPVYRRSPVWSHSRSPPRVQNHNTTLSPNTVRVEGGNQTSLVQLSVPHSLKHGSASTGSNSSYANKPPSESGLCRQTTKTQSMQSMEEFTPKSEAHDQRILKVRIKVGSDDLSVKKNAELYSGLGLDDSPTSSFDNSPAESEGLSRGQSCDAHESPTQILRIMTSFPPIGGFLLSPLPANIIQLSERPKLLKDILCVSSSKINHENSILGYPSNSIKDKKTFSGENGMKLLDRKGLPLQVKREGENSRTDFDFSLKESDIDAASCEELVWNTLKLPLLSDTYSTMGDSVKDALKEKVYDAAKREPLEPFSIPVSMSNKSIGKVSSGGNVVDSQLVDVPDERISDSKKIGGKGEVTNSLTNTDIVGMKFKKPTKGELKTPVQKKSDKPSSSKSRMGLARSNKQLSSGEKKKSKRSQVHSSSRRKAGRQSDNDIDSHACKSELESSPSQKKLTKARDKYSKARDTYKDFFGDMNEQEAEMMDSPNVPSRDGLKTSEVVENGVSANENSLKGRTGNLEANKQAVSRTDLKGSSHNASLSDKGRPISDLAPAGADVEENWVCCDKCQAWRLLPPGSKVDSLPEKWDCSMLTWLSGMNRCGISDEETTKAVRARYQLLAENSNSLQVPPDTSATGMISTVLDPSMLSNEKFIDQFRKTSKSSFLDSAHQPPRPLKKKQQAAKERTLAEAKKSPVMNRPDSLQESKSSGTCVGTNQHKNIDKYRAGCDPGGGHSKIPKIKSKKEQDDEFPRASKKSKKPIMQSGVPAEYQGNDMRVVSSGFGLSTNTSLKDKLTNSELFFSQKSKDDVDDDSLIEFEKLKNRTEGFQDVASLYVKKSVSGTVAPRKRKVDDFQGPASSALSSGTLMPDHDEFSRKRHRVSKSEGKESSTSKRNVKSEKRSKSISQQSLNIIEPLPKDSSCAPPVVAATSSSSKVSGSLKARSKLQDLKGSPVESVSSSPFRISNSDKLISRSKTMVEKDNIEDVVKLETCSPKKCSVDDHQYVDDQSGFMRKDDSLDPGRQIPDRCVNEATGDAAYHNINVSDKDFFWKDSSSLCKDKMEFKSNFDKGKSNISESYGNTHDYGPVSGEREREEKIKVPENFGSDVDKPDENVICNNQELSSLKRKRQQDYDRKRSSKKFDVGKSEQSVPQSAREKSIYLSASDAEKTEKLIFLRSKQGNGTSTSSTDAWVNDLPKEPKSNTKADTQNGTHLIPSKHSISNGHRIKSQDAPSPLRRDGTGQAACNAIKEAKTLKHLADRQKQGAGSTESTGLYFEAALKFLHGASLLESGKTENPKHADMLQSLRIYSDTAKLCEFCAREYEKYKDMATAALAYKCMEVAYLRVIYSSHHSASRDRHELQTVLQMFPPGESPSSSASDIDNLNNSATMDKDLLVRNGGNPQVATNLVIAPKNRPNFKRLLTFAQDVNFAMEASRKSHVAFAAAANVNMNQEKLKDVMVSIKRALDFNFHDVQGLLRLVRLAKEATSR